MPAPHVYLEHAFRYVRDAGGVCIADEVQVGFGRVGEWFWGFETQGVVPDIVTLGKPIGNGHPLAAVVTTEPDRRSVRPKRGFFSTLGGTPLSCEIGLAVLDVIRDEGCRRTRPGSERTCWADCGSWPRRPVDRGGSGSGLYLG